MWSFQRRLQHRIEHNTTQPLLSQTVNMQHKGLTKCACHIVHGMHVFKIK